MADIKITLDVSNVKTGTKVIKRSLDDITTSATKMTSSLDVLQKGVDSTGKEFKESTSDISSYIKQIDKLESELKQSQTQVKKLEKELNGLDTTQKKVKDSTSSLSGTFKTIRAAAVGYATVLATMEIQQFITGTIQAGVELDSLQRSFKAITGDAGLAAQQMSFVKGISEDLGLELTTLEKSYKDILAASRGTSLEGENVQRVFLSINKAAAVLGMSADDTQGSLRALSQMISKGNVQAIVKSLALYTAMYIENPVNSGKTLTLKMRAILSHAWKIFQVGCNDYLLGEYTQVSGSAGHPIGVMI